MLDDLRSIPLKDLATAASVLVAVTGLLYAWHKDRLLKRREVADRVRRAAATVTAKLERWKAISLSFFDELQPLITDTDVLFVNVQSVVATRDFWWRATVAARGGITRLMLSEQIELAYVDLYGYDASVRALFTHAIAALRHLDEVSFAELLIRTQKDVLRLSPQEGQLSSAFLGNRLRTTTTEAKARLSFHIDEVLTPFRVEMLKLINASDSHLYSKCVKLADWETVAPRSEESLLSHRRDEWQTTSQFLDALIDGNNCWPIVIISRRGSVLRSYVRGEHVECE